MDESTTLDELEVVKPLGRGAGSFVFLVRRRKTNEYYAMKAYKKEKENEKRIE
jgi:serine/threonine protein kinase